MSENDVVTRTDAPQNPRSSRAATKGGAETRPDPYGTDLDRNPANYEPLSPISFLSRAASIFPKRTALIHGTIRRSWAETHLRCRRLASALAQRGIGRGDTVALMAPNIPAAYEAAFGVPMAGAVLNALNIRLDAEAIAFMLDHGEAKAILTDTEFAPVIEKALALAKRKPLVVDIDDPMGPGGQRLGGIEYEELVDEGDPEFEPLKPRDEWDAIALNYTSGTTGDPKGVVFNQRGADLNARSNLRHREMPRGSG
jgi:fatty-acyl-CoA synthase